MFVLQLRKKQPLPESRLQNNDAENETVRQKNGSGRETAGKDSAATKAFMEIVRNVDEYVKNT